MPATADGGPTPLFRLYRLGTRLLVPLVWAVVSRKLRRHGVEVPRMHERLGHASLPRPAAPVIWFHAASVGESLSVLALIRRLGEMLPQAEFLITSGTASSAQLIGARLPPRSRHQFAPLDAPGPVGRFLDHWRPAAGIFVESEIWPNLLVTARARGVPLALVNARLSAAALRGWHRHPDTARFLLSRFDLLMAQGRDRADDLLSLGADPARVVAGTNLKAAASPPPVDAAALAAIRTRLEGRPVWIASSTHPGEEEIVLAAHRRLLRDRPDLHLVLVPRHPERGDEVARTVRAAGLALARRCRGALPGPGHPVYLADTLGETGTWYALSPIVFLGATLVPKGGHNPYEPAMAGCAIMAGPHRDNAAQAYAGLEGAGALATVHDAADIAAQVARWLDERAALDAARRAGQAHVQALDAALDSAAGQLIDALGLEEHARG